MVRSKISVQEANRLVTSKVSESVNQCYGMSPVFVGEIEPGSSSGEFVLKLDGCDVFCIGALGWFYSNANYAPPNG